MLDAADLSPSPFILALPKAELHLHLEGTVEGPTLNELRRRHSQPELSADELDRLYHFHDFNGFMMAFKQVTLHMLDPEDYELVTYRMMERLAQENVRHAEVYVSVGVVQWRKQDFDPIFEGLERGRRRGERDFGVSVLWIFDAVRHFGVEHARPVVEKAIQFKSRNVVGIGIGGDERRGPAEHFGDVYAYARNAGLRLTAHAGETTGADCVRASLDVLHAERIGHGLNAIHDRALVERLAREQIPVEICITSNIRTGCCGSLESHPVRKLFDAGVLITLNTDDPAMFRTSLAREYQLAQTAFGFTDPELRQLAQNSFRASFLPDSVKDRFTTETRSHGSP